MIDVSKCRERGSVNHHKIGFFLENRKERLSTQLREKSINHAWLVKAVITVWGVLPV